MEWFDELIWCPSQCYTHVHLNGVDYILYLRWRWEDPWQARIVRNAKTINGMHADDAEWTGDIFEEHGLFFTDEEIDKARGALVDLFIRLYGKPASGELELVAPAME